MSAFEEMYGPGGTMARVGMPIFAECVREVCDPGLGEPLERFYFRHGIAPEWTFPAWQPPAPQYPPLPVRVPAVPRSRGLAVRR